MPDLETIIGLEVHAQASTETKMFCACGNDSFGKPPNSTVCPICAAHPGSLPVPNEEAILKGVRAALALRCRVERSCHFDRKNYFYPDLPAGFQISQYTIPLSRNGLFTYSFRGEECRCRITRLHLECDAGKLIHRGGKTLCDFNRAGTPLMEIVTEPDLRSPGEARAFTEELRRTLIAVGASDADMYKGMMRFDASVSLRPRGEKELYPRAEIKNLNSFEALEAALTFEGARQQREWLSQGPPKDQITVSWNAEEGKTEVLREKETAADYRYFPEPDIPPLEFSEDLLGGIEQNLPPLPEQIRRRYTEMGLGEREVVMLMDQPEYQSIFDFVLERTGDVGRARSLVLTQLVGFLKERKFELKTPRIIELLGGLLAMSEEGEIHRNQEKEILEKMVTENCMAEELVAKSGIKKAERKEVEDCIERAIAANAKAIEDYRRGKAQALSAVVGWVMKETGGGADPRFVQELLREKLTTGEQENGTTGQQENRRTGEQL